MQTGKDKGKFEGRVPICLSQQFFLFGNEKAEDRYFVFVDHRKLLMTSAKEEILQTPLKQLPSRSHCLFLPGMPVQYVDSAGKGALLLFPLSSFVPQKRQIQWLELMY